MCERLTRTDLGLGERTGLEITLAWRIMDGQLLTTWFVRCGSTPTTELPAHRPDDYRTFLVRRVELIRSDCFIGLLERTQYNRRRVEPWEDQDPRALQTSLLDRQRSPYDWNARRLTSVRMMAGRAAADCGFTANRDLLPRAHLSRPTAPLTELVEAQGTPATPVHRPAQSAKTMRRSPVILR